jgi:predicted ATPase
MLHQFRREGQLFQEQAEAAITLSTEQGFPHWLAVGTLLRGWALAAQGQGAEGVAQMHQGLAARRAAGAELGRPLLLALLAEAYRGMGQAEEGLALVAEALAVVNNSGERHWEAELYRLKGELLLEQGGTRRQANGNRQPWGEAEACFHQALDIARYQQAKSWELRAAMSLSRLWQRQGKRAEARELLAPVYDWFPEGFDTADLQDAKALLAALI